MLYYFKYIVSIILIFILVIINTTIVEGFNNETIDIDEINNSPKKFITYKSYISAGLSHQLSNLNNAIKHSYKLGKTLVLPIFKLSGVHNNNNKLESNLTKYYDFNKLKVNNNRVNVITDINKINEDELINVKINNQLFRKNKIITSVLKSSAVMKIDLPYNKNILKLSKQVRDKLGKYMCIHLRRGDMLGFKPGLNEATQSDNIIKTINKFAGKYDNIYIMTNEKDLSMFDKVRHTYQDQVFFYTDFAELTDNDEDNYYLFCIEKDIMNNAHIRISTFKTNNKKYHGYLSELGGHQ